LSWRKSDVASLWQLPPWPEPLLFFVHLRSPLITKAPARLPLSRGRLTNHQLRLALDAQKANGGGRIGEWLLTLGFATEQEITSALGLQWACPVLASSAIKDLAAARMLPYRLLESFRMCPIQYVEATRTLYMSFSERIDHTALYAIQQMLGCLTEPSVVSPRTMDSLLDRVGRERGPGDLLFESSRDPFEMAQIACGYVLKFGAENVRIVACGKYLWARLQAGQEYANLLFRLPPAAFGRPSSSPLTTFPTSLPARVHAAGA